MKALLESLTELRVIKARSNEFSCSFRLVFGTSGRFLSVLFGILFVVCEFDLNPKNLNIPVIIYCSAIAIKFIVVKAIIFKNYFDLNNQH